MSSINALILMLSSGFLLSAHPATAPARITWIVQKASTLSINGHTNVSRFSCGIAQYSEPDTITFLNEGCRNKTTGVPLFGVLRINIQDFDCRNRIMTGEFKKTLQYRQYPQLKITFLNLEKMPAFGQKPETLTGQVTIELAGISRQFEMEYTSAREDAETIQLHRQPTPLFFGLRPPAPSENGRTHPRRPIPRRPVHPMPAPDLR
ncbi:hypothetical protein ACQ86N_25410 [Puia sp. P3]|uniref:hypothetical protein n=1 Tax=Puia sp. P3 TaxID=3423952 RepID=UPI003D6717C9